MGPEGRTSLNIGLAALCPLSVILPQVISRVLAARLYVSVVIIFYVGIVKAIPQGRRVVNIGQWEFSFNLVLEGGTGFLGLFDTLGREFGIVL